MIKIKLYRLMGEKRLNIQDVADLTGIHRTTIAKLYKEETESIKFDTIDKLCKGLNCKLTDIIDYIPDDE